MKVKITTTIDSEQYALIKQHNWKMSQVLEAGVGALVNPSVLQDQMQEQKRVTEELKRSILNLRTKVAQHIEKEILKEN